MINGWLLFWTLIAIGCMLWYSTATIYIAIRGALDIQTMLAHLKDENVTEVGQSQPGEALADRAKS